MNFDSLKLSEDLIKFPSISGTDAGIIDFLVKILSAVGFKCDVLDFDGDSSYPVKNLHAVYNPNNSKNIFYFAGHTDVVPVGDEKAWKFPPFAAKVENNILYGRGAVDMKCAIASFICAAFEFISQNKNPNFGIGLLITGDEEADAVNGTKKMLEWMQQNNQSISACIVGEPTNPTKLGEMIKIGRRGSVSFVLKIIGKQGHVAYPENADNPITSLINVLKILKDYKLDEGNEFFDPSNLEITTISAPNVGGNVIPENASANFNIRFNNNHTSESLISFVKYVCEKSAGKYELTYKVTGESFLTNPGFLSEIISKSIADVVGISPKLSTTGGTSDARFIKDFCEVVECGLINKTAHQVDENIAVSDIYNLQKIYLKILQSYSAK